MRQLINILTGLVIGLLPVAGMTIIGIVVASSIPNIAGKIIFVLLELLSLWLGYTIFKKIQVVGPIDFLTAIIASPDMDNLEPTEDSETKRRSSEELVNLINNNNNLFKGGAFRIFGDWFGKPYDNYHSIESANFNSELNKLTLVCKEGESLEIYNPNHIFEASTFLKIISAHRIKLTWYYDGKNQVQENPYFIDYKRNEKRIETETNVDWYKPMFDVSLGQPALMIYG